MYDDIEEITEKDAKRPIETIDLSMDSAKKQKVS